jgi:thioredoxin-related protein
MRKLLIICFILFSGSIFAQKLVPPSMVKWYTLKQALELNKQKPRPIMIDFYTDWCGFCTQMMNTTFTDATVTSYLNNNFYPVRFDAEGSDTVVFNDTTYIRPAGQKTHNFAIHILKQQLMYPTIVMITKQNTRANIPGFHTADKFIPILIYFNEEVYNTSTFEDFDKYYQKVFPSDKKDGYMMVRSKVKWMKLEDALEANQKKPKKIFIEFTANWSNASTIMLMTTYTDSLVADLLNNQYYPVRIDATTKDTLNFGAPYINDGKYGPYHQLPVAMLGGKMRFPATLYLDEASKLVNVMHDYLAPELMIPILSYYGSDLYKKQKWLDYYTAYLGKKEKEKKLKEQAKEIKK